MPKLKNSNATFWVIFKQMYASHCIKKNVKNIRTFALFSCCIPFYSWREERKRMHFARSQKAFYMFFAKMLCSFLAWWDDVVEIGLLLHNCPFSLADATLMKTKFYHLYHQHPFPFLRFLQLPCHKPFLRKCTIHTNIL